MPVSRERKVTLPFGVVTDGEGGTELSLIVLDPMSAYSPLKRQKVPPTIGTNRSMRTAIKIILATILALPLAAFVAFKVMEVRYLKGFLPPDYGTIVLEHKTSLVVGFGPGGHDALLVFFRLSDGVADKIARGGLNWLQVAEKSVQLRRSKIAGEWVKTPLPDKTFAWTGKANCEAENSDWWTASHTDHSCPGIAAYLRGYGFLDKLDVSKTEAVDRILQSGTAYVSKRRVGYLIVAPEQGLVVFAHAG